MTGIEHMTLTAAIQPEDMLMDNNIYSVKNFDFLARTFAIMQVEGHPVDLDAITGNMDEEHRCWFCERYAYYCEKESPEQEPLMR